MKRIRGASRRAAMAPYSCTPGSPKITRTPSRWSEATRACPPVIRAIDALLSGDDASRGDRLEQRHVLALGPRPVPPERLPRLVPRAGLEQGDATLARVADPVGIPG